MSTIFGKPLDIPIALIIFRRPDTTSVVLNAIRLVRPSKLYVIADGPRFDSDDEKELVTRTRQLIETIDWDCEVIKIYSDVNMGLRERVLSGLDEVFEVESGVIVLEDDCLPGPDFFMFSAELLTRFQKSSEIGLISGNNFAPRIQDESSYYFSTQANIWGWATWSRTWREFRETSVQEFQSPEVRQRVSQAISGRYQRLTFMKMFDRAKELDSWAIQFSAFCLLRQKLSVVPHANLVTNIGFGAESTHTKFESYVDEVAVQALEFPLKHPTKIYPDVSEMRRQSRIKAAGWLQYPFLHPFDFLGRVIRYLRIRN